MKYNMSLWKEEVYITIYNIPRSTGKKGIGIMDNYLETSFTTVSWNWRNILYGD